MLGEIANYITGKKALLAPAGDGPRTVTASLFSVCHWSGFQTSDPSD